jgi:hypothetical protein
MARKLKTYTTSIGFYDLAVAAPSMKAALEAWGSPQNLFHQGLASETEDPEIITAAMEKPGLVVRRAVGSDAPYREKADPPRALPAHASKKEPPARKPSTNKPNAKTKARKAAIIPFEEARAGRAKQRRDEEARHARERAMKERDAERRRKAVDKAQAALDRAHARHAAQLAGLEKERQAVDEKLNAERERWRREEQALQGDIRDADLEG